MKRRVSAAKKIVAVALAATVAVSLTGCKKRKNNTNAASSDVTRSRAPVLRLPAGRQNRQRQKHRHLLRQLLRLLPQSLR